MMKTSHFRVPKSQRFPGAFGAGKREQREQRESVNSVNSVISVNSVNSVNSVIGSARLVDVAIANSGFLYFTS